MSSFKNCSNCKRENPAEAKFCWNCGHRLQKKENIIVILLIIPVIFFFIVLFAIIVFVVLIRSCTGNESDIYSNDTTEILEDTNLYVTDSILSKTNKQTITSPPDDFILVNAGTLHNKEFDMENNKDVYCHYQIDAFYICIHELTQGEYEKTIGHIDKTNYEWTIPGWDNPEKKIHVKGNSIPVVAEYLQFAKYCNRRSQDEGYDGFYIIDGNNVKLNPHGNGYRLLFEMEWIYAAKGGVNNDTFKYIGSNNLREVAWFGANSNNKPHEISTKKPNSLGIYDMAGNVSEMLESKYNDKWRYFAGNDFYTWTGYSADFFTPYDICYYMGNDLHTGTRLALVTKEMNNNNSIIKAKYN